MMAKEKAKAKSKEDEEHVSESYHDLYMTISRNLTHTRKKKDSLTRS
jgi:hypothetical protein